MRPVPMIFGILAAVLVALGFLMHAFDPFTAGRSIRFLFLGVVFLAVVSLASLVIYAIAVMWHEGPAYFVAQYFGPEFAYFSVALRRAMLVGVLALALVSLRQLDLFTRYFAGGAASLIIIFELIFSFQDRYHIRLSKISNS